MASFDENGKYIKTNWKAGDKITATKLNKIEESIEAVNDNDISRYDEMRDKFIILEAKDAEHDKELTNIEGLVSNNKAETDSEIQLLESDMNALESDIQTLESDVDALESEIAELKATDEAIQNDMNSAQTQTYFVTDAYKFTVDHDGMMPSLVTLNNIEGLSSIETNVKGDKQIVSRSMKHICTIDTNKNYFDDAIIGTIHGDATYTRENNNVTVISNVEHGAVEYTIPNLEDDKKYCIMCDDIIITSGDAQMQIATPNEYKPIRSTSDFDSNSNDAVFRGHSSSIVTFHCSRTTTEGNVTYENVQIYEVKEMIVPDIQLLNSLPNGVKDEIKDGMLIKRTKHVNLAELTWIPSSTNVQFPESEFVVYYTHDTPDLIADPDAWENELGHILCNNIPSVPIAVTASADPSNATCNRAGISGHKEWGELRIKLYRSGVPDVTALKTWLDNNDVYAVYELESPEYIPINTTIKADKGDTVVINTTKTMDFTYDIQLNTRAQIDALQETVVRTVDTVTSELRAADVASQYELRYDQFGNGYYILPGGLIIQFGYVAFPANYSSTDTIDFILTFPTPFPNQVISTLTSMSGGDNGWDSRVSGYATSNSQARIVIRGLNYTIPNTMCWLVIGR